MKRRLLIGFQVLVAVAILGVLAMQVNLDRLRLILSTAAPLPLTIAVLSLAPALFARSWRLQVICNHNAKRRMTAWQAFVVTIVGAALNLITPGSAGEVVRAYYAYLYTGDKDGMLVASVLDKFGALVALFAIGATALFLADPMLLGTGPGGTPVIWPLRIITTFIFLALTAIFFEERIIPWGLVERLLNKVLKGGFDASRMKAVWALPHRIRALVLAQSLAGWLITYVQFHGIVLALGGTMTFSDVLLVGPIINLMPFVPITFAGLGTMEAAIYFLLKPYGMDESAVVLVAFVFRLLNSLLPGAWGVWFLWKLRKQAPPELQSE